MYITPLHPPARGDNYPLIHFSKLFLCAASSLVIYNCLYLREHRTTIN